MKKIREYIKKLIDSLKSPALKKIRQSYAPERGRLILLGVLYAFSAVVSLGFTLVMRELIDAAVAGNFQRLIIFIIALIASILISLGLGYASSVLQAGVRANLLKIMREEAVNKILRKKYAGLSAYHSGELVNRVFSDVSIVAGGVVSIVPPLLNMVIQLVGASLILARLNGFFLLILLAAGIAGTIISYLLRNKMKAFHKETQGAEDKLHARVQETLENVRIIKASGTEERMAHEAGIFQVLFKEAQMRRAKFSAWMGTVMGLVFRGSWVYALLWGCFGIYNGTISYGTLTAILQLVGQVQYPFEGLISTMGTLFGMVSSAERLMELYDLPDEIERTHFSPESENFVSLKAEDVCFAYDEKPVLGHFNMEVKAGQSVAVMGHSGCGKTTLFSLLLGIYEPDGGRIVFETDSRSIDGGISGLFAYVPQGNELFSGTLRENIMMFSNREVSEDDIRKAAETACILDFIDEQEEGLDTAIGERGVGISEGQAQRIAIARAVLSDCPVLLLDESTSALDSETEARLLKNISALKKTCIIVTHREAALKICDSCVDMEKL